MSSSATHMYNQHVEWLLTKTFSLTFCINSTKSFCLGRPGCSYERQGTWFYKYSIFSSIQCTNIGVAIFRNVFKFLIEAFYYLLGRVSCVRYNFVS